MLREILNYEVVRLIGKGSMGEVYLARNKSIHQFVAIKSLRPRFVDNAELRDRFRQEAIMLSALNHVNIVKFLNYVENDDGVFLIMEYVDGMTLEDFILKKNGLIVEERAYPLMQEILEAFAYAHDRGIVHRDIKPSNILITKNGHIKILDFGIAKIVSESSNENGQYAGSLLYMSPEQACKKTLDLQSDIYSLGVVFYQMLTGRAPYDTTTMTSSDILHKIVEEPLCRMRETYPYISEEIQKFVDKATSKKTNERFIGCREMLDTLNKIGRMSNNKGDVKSDIIDRTPSDDKIKAYSGARKLKLNLGIRILIVAFILVSVCLSVWYFLYGFESETEKKYYYYSNVYGVATGVIKVKGETTPYYGLTSSRKHLQRFKLYGDSETINNIDSIYTLFVPAECRYGYYKDGTLNYKEICNNSGKVLYKLTYNDNLRIGLLNKSGSDSVTWRLRFSYDTLSGRLNKAVFINDIGTITPNEKGVAGCKFSYDTYGRLKRVVFFDSMGLPISLPDGIAMIEFDYCNNKFGITTLLYDIRGCRIPKADKKELK